MSEKTDSINSQWPDATSTWDNPKDVTENTPISAKENHNQLTVLLSRDIYTLDQVENNLTTVNSSIDAVSSRVTVVERTTNELTATVGDIIANGGGGGTGSDAGSPISNERILEIWNKA